MPDNFDIDPVEAIPVLVTHLEVILHTIDRALRKSMAEDMSEFYRSQQGRSPQQSLLTKNLDKAVQRVAGYLGVSADYE